MEQITKIEKFEVMIQGVNPEVQAMVKKDLEPFYLQLQPIIEKVYEIKVDSIDDIQGMKLADTVRKQIKPIRTATERRRVELKADYLQTGKMIDKVANSIKDAAQEAEAYLLEQSTYGERMEKERLDAIEVERMIQLKEYIESPELYNVRDMSDVQWANTLAGAKLQYEATETKRKEAEAAAVKAEKDRIAKEAADAAERERLRLENEALKQQSIAREAKMQAEREQLLRETAANNARLKAEQDLRDIAAREALKAEREQLLRERAASEAKMQAKQDAIRLEASKREAALKEEQALKQKEYDKKIAEAAKTNTQSRISPFPSTNSIPQINTLKTANFASEREQLIAWVEAFDMPEMATSNLTPKSQQTIATIYSRMQGFKNWAKSII